MRRLMLLFTAALFLAVGLSSCSDGDAGTSEASTSEASTSVDVSAPTCDRPVEDPPVVDPVADRAADHEMRSFDVTLIRLHWFPSPDATDAEPAPTILSGPGWSLP